MTTNVELKDMVNQLGINNFRGVFMKDELKNMKPLENECCICNFEKTTQDGSHWVAWYKIGDDKYYFDSFGADILPEIKNYLLSPIWCHNFQIQDFNSEICGELCVLFLYLMSKSIPYEDVILSLVS